MAAQGVLIDNDSKQALVPAKPMLSDLLDRAVDKQLPADAIAKLWEINKELEDRDARKAYIEAFNLFKRNRPAIKKNKHVKAGSAEYDHATLDHLCDVLIPALNAVGISHRYRIEPQGELIYVTCILTHEAGHSEETTLFGMPDKTGSKNSVQAIGSTVTYLQRYTLLAATGLATEGQDDDGRGGDVDDLDGRLEEIKRASDLKALAAIFKVHYDAATKANDGRALLRITQAKDKRREELEG